MCACQQSATNEPLRILLQHGADPCLQTPTAGLTALHLAAKYGSISKCIMLLEAGRRTLELRADGGRSPLCYAVLSGQLPVVELLYKSYSADIFTVDDNGRTLLHSAVLAKQPHQHMLAYLLRTGLDVNAVDGTARTPLNAAAGTANAAAVQMLLEHGADPTIKDQLDSNALDSACSL
jgi:uncharacterized protein